MDPSTLKVGDRVSHPDFGEGSIQSVGPGLISVEWDRQGYDIWARDDKRWEQVEVC